VGDIRNINDGEVNGTLVQIGHAEHVGPPGIPPEAMGALPPQDGAFVGRADEVGILTAALRPHKGHKGLPGDPAVVVLSGPAGIGKLALAVHTAEKLLADNTYSDVLYVDLRGDEESGVVHPDAALGEFLTAMGMGRGKDIPAQPAVRKRLYLSRMRDWAKGGRRVLVLLDGVGSADQATPLFPGRGHGVLVVSRHTLAEVDGRHVQLGPLTERESLDLLAARLRAHDLDYRVVREPDAALTLVRLCGRVPFALRIAAAILNDMPRMRIADLVTDLRDAAGERLATLRFSGLDLRVLLDRSYRRLKPHVQQMFRLLCLFPGPQVSLEAAVALSGGVSATTTPQLNALRRANLLMPATPGTGYVVPELVRLYGAERARREEPAASVREAEDRLFTYYRNTTATADDCIRGGAEPARFPSRATALEWLDTERPCLSAVVRHGYATGRDEVTIDIVLRLRYFFELRRRWDEWTGTVAVALACAHRSGDRGAQARLLEAVGDAFRLQEAREVALAQYDQARRIYLDLDDQSALRGVTDRVMSIVSVRRGHHHEAVRHYRDAVRHYRDLGEHRLHADALNNLGLAYLALGDRTKAAEAHRQAFELRCERHDLRGQAQSLTNLGNVHLREDRLDAAIRCYAEAAALFEECDDRHGQAEALANEGAARLASGDVREARRAWQQSMTTFPEGTQQDDMGERLSGIRVIARWRNKTRARNRAPYAYAVVFPLAVAVAIEAWPDAPEDREDQARQLDLRWLDGAAVAVTAPENGSGEYGADGGFSGGGGGPDTLGHDPDRDEEEQDTHVRRVGIGGYDSGGGHDGGGGYDSGGGGGYYSGGGGGGGDFGSHRDHHYYDDMF
jgi:tetratricopeptide (TPR) repeat protein